MAEEETGGPKAAGVAAGLVDLESMKGLLASDDKVLEKLQRLAEETSVEGLDGSQNDKEGDIVEKVRKMTVKLASLMTAVVRLRLDRAYIETLAGGQESDAPVEDIPDQDEYLAALKADIESLDAEIPAVAKMSAEAEFLRPVVGEVQKRKGLLEEVVSGRGGYVCSPTPTAHSLIFVMAIPFNIKIRANDNTTGRFATFSSSSKLATRVLCTSWKRICIVGRP